MKSVNILLIEEQMFYSFSFMLLLEKDIHTP